MTKLARLYRFRSAPAPLGADAPCSIDSIAGLLDSIGISPMRDPIRPMLLIDGEKNVEEGMLLAS